MTAIGDLQHGDRFEVVREVRFGLLSPEEILRRSHVEVTTNELYNGNSPVPNGVLDMRMGVVDATHVCPTCNNRSHLCPGHFGHIRLCRPMFYVQFIDTCKKLMRCICFKCSALALDLPPKKARALLRLPRSKRFDAIYQMCAKTSKRDCPVCSERQPSTISRHLVFWFDLEWRKDGKDAAREDTADAEDVTRLQLYPEDVEKIFKRIPDPALELLGFVPGGRYPNRPEWMICTVHPVPPPAIRPTVHNEIGQRREDDLTHKLCEIVKHNRLLKAKMDEGATLKDISPLSMLLQYHIATYADNELPNMGAAQHRNGRPIKSVEARLKAKEGRIRGNLMGKRVNQSARSVITPDPNISIDELGVPLRIAMHLTFPEVVGELNVEALQLLVDNGPAVYPGARFVHKADKGITIRLNGDVRVKLEEGDVVDRHLVNGDYVLFNRQPSLHKMSMMAHRVRVMTHDTFRLNVCVTPCYNADYDGDEMNMHVPQSVQTSTELRMLAAVPLQMMSPRTSAPIINVVQDIALGIYRLTAEGVRVPRAELFSLLSVLGNFQGAVPALQEGTARGVDVLSTVIPTGVFLDTEAVVIDDGDVQRGQLTKKTYANEGDSNNLLQLVFKELGPDTARRLLDDTQRLICEWLCVSGFSVGISDLVLHEDMRAALREAIEGKKREISAFIASIHDGTFQNEGIGSPQEYFEQRIKALLTEADDAADRLIKLDGDNRLLCMVRSGSKGKQMNIQQMTGLLGQQGVEGGKRVPYGFEDRTLPHFTKHDDSPEARGFVERGFLEGLRAHEFFFHAMAGREGLIDTAVKTSDTGYIQRKLIKAMEDCKVAMDMSVRGPSGQLVQFGYGGDGFDACKLEVQKCPTVHLPLWQIPERYGIPPEDAGALRQVLTKSAWERLVATEATWPGRMRAYVERVIADRRTFAVNCAKGRKNGTVYFPVNFQRLLVSTQRLFCPDGPVPTDVLPTDVLDAIEELAEGLRPCGGQPANRMLGILLRAHLNPRELLFERGLPSEALSFLKERIRASYADGLVHPSELVGVLAAQSIGEPATQMTLNTFHSAGYTAAAKAVHGVPRLSELLRASKNIKAPSMQIHLLPPACDSAEDAQTVLNELEMTYLRDVLAESSIWYDPQDAEIGIEDDAEFVGAWRRFSAAVGCTSHDFASPWLVRLVADRDRMLEKGLTMHDVYHGISRQMGEDAQCMYSDDNAGKLVFRLRLRGARGRDLLQDVKAFEQQLVEGLVLKGVAGLKKIVKRKHKFTDVVPRGNPGFATYDESMQDYRTYEAFVLDTDGSNLQAVLAHPLVDAVHTRTNNVQEVLAVLGIEAARAAIMEEIRATLADLAVQERHLELLVDVMTVKGGIMPIDRHGINKSDNGPLAKISFEETADRLIQAAVFSEADPMTGVSACIMLGQLPAAGTGDTKLLVDTAKLTVPYRELPNRAPAAQSCAFAEMEVGFEGDAGAPFISMASVGAFSVTA